MMVTSANTSVRIGSNAGRSEATEDNVKLQSATFRITELTVAPFVSSLFVGLLLRHPWARLAVGAVAALVLSYVVGAMGWHALNTIFDSTQPWTRNTTGGVAIFGTLSAVGLWIVVRTARRVRKKGERTLEDGTTVGPMAIAIASMIPYIAVIGAVVGVLVSLSALTASAGPLRFECEQLFGRHQDSTQMDGCLRFISTCHDELEETNCAARLDADGGKCLEYLGYKRRELEEQGIETETEARLRHRGLDTSERFLRYCILEKMAEE